MKDKITLDYGSGGRKTHRLIKELFLKYFKNPILERLEDAAEIEIKPERLAFTTDSYVVKPLFFPGGDIGKLSIFGTCNDLAVKGARPLYISVSFIIREGLSLKTLERVVESMSEAARVSHTQIITGDTKVIEKGEGEELFITTTGIGVIETKSSLSPKRIEIGDRVYISGGIGEHEVAIILARGDFEFKAEIESDCGFLYPLISEILKNSEVHMMRDPTRGGLATTLNEITQLCGKGVIIEEERLVIKKEVLGICDLLGFDPLYLANEGKVIIIGRGERLLNTMKNHPLGREGREIGRVVEKPKGVWLKTPLGSLRPLLMLEGQQLPRIC